ncbi:hypothetical protein PPACK8108_LOCUS25429 [Phakopsora pachyrhizi]|uniref:Uncharacterized protein n=1 Tax=Phakopsora pachyrhizi TaxID=170000 RepID=A0AAV0BTP2_PHAPC|nr:hypothetical protein PPACK8108_LOCUS25429 [Phakopsora pachyrhizi]
MLNSVYCTWLILSYLCNTNLIHCCIISIMLNSVYSPWLILSYLCHENLIYVLPYIALHAKGLVR